MRGPTRPALPRTAPHCLVACGRAVAYRTARPRPRVPDGARWCLLVTAPGRAAVTSLRWNCNKTIFNAPFLCHLISFWVFARGPCGRPAGGCAAPRNASCQGCQPYPARLRPATRHHTRSCKDHKTEKRAKTVRTTTGGGQWEGKRGRGGDANRRPSCPLQNASPPSAPTVASAVLHDDAVLHGGPASALASLALPGCRRRAGGGGRRAAGARPEARLGAALALP